MNNAGDLTPLAPPRAGASWLRRHRLPLVAAGSALAVGAVTASVALALLAKPANTVEKMVPASAEVMVLANLDPSLTQKVNLMRALHRFPQATSDKAITEAIDNAFKATGLSFSGDIQPWLGAEVGISARLNDGSTTTSTTAALYVLSRDDVKAKAALARLRLTDSGKKLQWRDETYNGFTISVGTPSASADKPAAYSYVDHVVVIASSSAALHEVIDTEQGRAPRLTETADFKATMAGLPADRVGLAYVNGRSLVAGIKKQLAKAPAASTPIMGNVTDLDAFVGIGATLSAAGNGLTADLVIKLDQSKLSPATRQALSNPGRPDVVLTWIPKGTDAFVAIGSLNRTIQTLVDASKSDPSIVASTNGVGLTGPGGVLSHLSGDAALEAHIGTSGTPSGAILVGTDDASSLKTFFGKLLALTNSGTGTSTATYHGVVISSIRSPQLGQVGVVPSYAVAGEMGVLGSSLAEVEAVIDAHQGGATIAADATYKAAAGGSLARPASIVYINIGGLLRAARGLPLKSAASGIDQKALASVEPIKALMLTGSSQADRALERLFLLID